ncbi:hypothetical protein MLD38_017669 [Melastoma candidum]|uniref:Uncharacterized protein n=1 Tax=Melastoma candidum TaxID=119954 RepID=A0ACB9QRB8_9MYRT|nr:hypothetical protein MLD38_017669 [Melastoma candidum]
MLSKAVAAATALSLAVLFLPGIARGELVYNVASFGARADGASDSSAAFLKAWAMSCSATTPATIYVPSGSFLLRGAKFVGPCRSSSVTFRIDGTIVAPSDYNVNGHSGYWILIRDVSGVSVIGGTLDGRGAGLWSCKARGGSCPQGATNLEFSNADNVYVKGLTSLNSQMFHIVINACKDVRIQGVHIEAPGTSPNTDGIHIGESDTVTVLGSKIGTGDDCISLGPGSSNVWIEGVSCGPGHGISIGSLGSSPNENGVQNVTVSTVTFTGTQNGVRIKSWAKQSNGFARHIFFQHATMNNVQNPIIIDQSYCPYYSGCSNEPSGVSVSDVTYFDIHGTSATEVAVNLDCSSEYPCSSIKLEDVKLTYEGNQAATSSCRNAGGTSSGVVVPSSCL